MSFPDTDWRKIAKNRQRMRFQGLYLFSYGQATQINCEHTNSRLIDEHFFYNDRQFYT